MTLRIILASSLISLINFSSSFASGVRGGVAVSLNSLHPVVIVPGDGGNQLEARVNKQNTVHFYCSKNADWFALWLNLESLLPGTIDCWSDNIKLVYNAATDSMVNNQGVETRVPGFGTTSGIDSLASDILGSRVATYFKGLTDALVANGLVRGVSIRGAPYDFRHTPSDDWIAATKALIEETYRMNSNSRIVLVSHSMGCIYTLRFLNLMSREWKDLYIEQWMPLAGAWHGSSNIIRLLASGYNEGVPTVSDISLREEQRTYETNQWLAPSPSSWLPSETLAIINGVSYGAHDYEAFYKAVGFELGWKLWQRSIKLTDDLVAPEVNVLCISSFGVSTPRTYVWDTTDLTKGPSSIMQGDGDGTVNLQSLQSVYKWKGANGGKDFEEKTFELINHAGMVTDKEVIDFVISAMQKLTVAPVTVLNDVDVVSETTVA